MLRQLAEAVGILQVDQLVQLHGQHTDGVVGHVQCLQIGQLADLVRQGLEVVVFQDESPELRQAADLGGQAADSVFGHVDLVHVLQESDRGRHPLEAVVVEAQNLQATKTSNVLGKRHQQIVGHVQYLEEFKMIYRNWKNHGLPHRCFFHSFI